MNNIKHLYRFFIGIVIGLWATFYFNLSVKIHWLKEISPILSALAAILNLIFVVTIFKINQRDKEKDNLLDRTSYWFRTIILDKNIDFIHESFSEVYKYNESLNLDECTDNKIREVIMTFQEQKRLLIISINDMIRILDVEFAEELDTILDEYEDSYTLRVEDLFTCLEADREAKKSELQKNILDVKNKYLLNLYRYEKNGYNLK